MSRRVRRKCAKGAQKLDLPNQPETEDADYLKLNEDGLVDWTRLPDDNVIQLFTYLNYRDRANLSSTCKGWRSLGSSPCLWKTLDLRAHKCDWSIMS
nr:protein ARABIDILLO 1-like [Tanacetum cinerariifolium]